MTGYVCPHCLKEVPLGQDHDELDCVDRLSDLIQKLLLGIDQWASDEDGIHEDCWDAYEAARAAIGHPLVIATVNGWEGRYQSLQGALSGEPWPPSDGDETDGPVLYDPTTYDQPAPGEGLTSGYVQAEKDERAG